MRKYPLLQRHDAASWSLYLVLEILIVEKSTRHYFRGQFPAFLKYFKLAPPESRIRRAVTTANERGR